MYYGQTTLTDTLVDIEIQFIGRLPTSAIALRLQVDDISHEFKAEARERVVKWTCGLCV